jgi:large subunit ribosomal protein L23
MLDDKNIILNPILTEKSSLLMEKLNQYVFRVSVNANKIQIKNEIEKRFNVKILKVSTMRFKGKQKNSTIRSGGHILRTSGKRSLWKKAVITLHKDSKIDLVEGDFN